MLTPQPKHPPTQTTPVRSHRPLYLKHVPTEVWQRLHIEAIQRGLTVTDHVLSFVTAGECRINSNKSVNGELTTDSSVTG